MMYSKVYAHWTLKEGYYMIRDITTSELIKLKIPYKEWELDNEKLYLIEQKDLKKLIPLTSGSYRRELLNEIKKKIRED